LPGEVCEVAAWGEEDGGRGVGGVVGAERDVLRGREGRELPGYGVPAGMVLVRRFNGRTHSCAFSTRGEGEEEITN